MANAYGTAEYESFIHEWGDYLSTCKYVGTEKDEKHYVSNGIQIDVITNFNTYNNGKYDCRLIANTITLTLKDGRSKTYETLDQAMDPTVFNFHGVDYVFMRKAIFGYCIIDTRSFEEYNYFPSAVLDHETEAFICVQAHCLKDLLILEGCYWGGPYEIYVLDLESKKVLTELEELKYCDVGNSEITLHENGFIIKDTKEYSVDYTDLKKRIEASETYDM